jgi:hypothetical protein
MDRRFSRFISELLFFSLTSVEDVVFRLMTYPYEPCRRWHLLDWERCRDYWLWNDKSTERQRRFLSLYELHCFTGSVSNPEIAVCSSLFSNPCNNSLRYALYQSHCEVFFIACCNINVLTQNPSCQYRAAAAYHTLLAFSSQAVESRHTKYRDTIIFLLHIREARVHNSSQTLAVCTQDFVASLSPSR